MKTEFEIELDSIERDILGETKKIIKNLDKTLDKLLEKTIDKS